MARAADAGLDVDATVNGLNQPLPLVRFQLHADYRDTHAHVNDHHTDANSHTYGDGYTSGPL